ncbi:MAG TPA: contractile injection system protein, VgrG/Pvc8 family, partial [Polyangiaceae bacterium]|nr:contractile injection system protein, VgrG/Pvc8 family [Polyangiaceae bacterium]
MGLDIINPVSFITGIFDSEKGGGKNDPFQLAAGPFFNHELRVLEFSGRERVNDVYVYSVTFATLEPAELLHAAVFGDPACLTIKAPGHEPRLIQGIASSLEALGAVPGEVGSKRRRYRIEIVPRLWLLKQRRKNRVFQNKTPKEIIAEILAGVKITPEECNWRIRVKDYPPLPFVYQRGQTDYDFFRSVLADAGIFFYFEHASGTLDGLLPGAGAAAGALGQVANFVGGEVGKTAEKVAGVTKSVAILNFGDEASHTPAV